VLDQPALRREALLAAVLASGAAVTLLVLAPPGVDLAAHAYQRTLFLAHGFTLWNNFWYSGRYSFVGYSLLYYPIAAVVGTTVLAVLSTSLAAAAFALLVCREWGASARSSSRAFAAVWPAIILAAAFPFALGAALAVLAVVTLQKGRTRSFAILTVLTLAASPLAFLILVVVALGIAVGRRPGWARWFGPAVAMAAAGTAQVVVMRLFPTAGVFPFTFPELVPALIFSVGGLALTYRAPLARPLSGFFGAYGIVCLLAFIVPSSLGSNVERLRYAAIPIALLVLALRNSTPRVLSLVVVVLAASWNLTPAVNALSRSSVDANQRYWAPAIRFLHAHLSKSYRVEVVDTADHWAAAYLPSAQIPIARGWFRQDDFPQNALLYDRRLASRAYLSWLRSLSVRYVLLTDAPADYSSRVEARLIASGRSGLTKVRQVGHISIYAVPHPRPLVTGPGPVTVLSFGPSELVLSIRASGRYLVAVNWSPYWSALGSCVQKAPNGQMTLDANRGIVHVRFSVGVEQGVETLLGVAPTHGCGTS
jgi:hypothetical protein